MQNYFKDAYLNLVTMSWRWLTQRLQQEKGKGSGRNRLYLALQATGVKEQNHWIEIR